MCLLCELEVEQLDHIFLKCEVAARTWNAMFKWSYISQPHFPSVIDLFVWIDQVSIFAKKKVLVDMAACTIIWYIWRFLNDKVFAGAKTSQSDIVDYIHQYSFIWFAK